MIFIQLHNYINFFEQVRWDNNYLSASSVNIYLLKVNNRSTRKRFKICPKLTIKIPERPQICSKLTIKDKSCFYLLNHVDNNPVKACK